MAYAIIRYKVMEIETVIHRTLMWLTTIVVAVSPFVALIFLSYDSVKMLSPMIVSALFSCLMILFYFYFQALQPRLDRIFQRRLTNMREELEKFSKEFQSVFPLA